MTAYIAIIFKVFKSQRRIKAHGESKINNSLNRESALARRVFAIILTDFCCWIPVIILSILALVKKFNDPDGTAYVWFAAFVLPVNSSVNPVLYTFSTPKVRRQMSKPIKSQSHKNRTGSKFVFGDTFYTDRVLYRGKTGLVLSNYCVFKGN